MLWDVKSNGSQDIFGVSKPQVSQSFQEISMGSVDNDNVDNVDLI